MNYRNLLLIVSLLFTLWGCRADEKLAERNLVAALKNPNRELALASIGPEDWDRMCVLTPYSTNKNAQATLGFPWNAERRTGIESRDDMYVLAFVNDDQVAMYLEMPRHEEDLLHSETLCFEFSPEATIHQDSIGNWTLK